MAFGVPLGAQRDDVGQLADGVEVAQGGQPGEPEGVEPITGQQRQVAVVGADHPGPAVVQEVALADRLDDERQLVLVAGRARPGGRERPVGGRGAVGLAQRAGQQPALVAQHRDEPAQDRLALRRHTATSANAAAAASTVRSTCSGVWASEGNHASNCDGGG